MPLNNLAQGREPQRLFVVDDEQRLLDAVVESLTANSNYSVSRFCSATECLQALKHSECDLVLTDVSMPELDGILFTKQIKDEKPWIQVIVMSGVADIPMAIRAVRAGASEFLEKPFSEESLLKVVERTLSTPTAELVKKLAKLTRAERQILNFIAEGKSNKDMASILNRSVRTVENHRLRLMQKLEIDNVAEAVKLALESQTPR